MSPIILPNGTTLPDSIPYTPRPPAVTSVVQNGVVISTRAALPGEPAWDATYDDDTLEAVVGAVNGLLGSLLNLSGGAKVFNDQSGQFETWPIYVSTVDPLTTSTPPANDNYVWINPTALAAGGGGTSGPATIDAVTGLTEALASKAASTAVYSRNQVDTLIAGIGTGGGGTVTLLEKSSGYCQASSTTPVTTPAANTSYIFLGLATPPFNREQDLWVVVDRGTVAAPVQISLVSSDDFDTGKNLATPAASALNTTKWGGDNTFFRQSSTGTLDPVGWGATSRNYTIFDKTQAASATMRAELQLAAYSSTTTQRTLRIVVNAADPNATVTTWSGYSVVMDTTSGGSTENWTVSRIEAGASTATVGSFTRARASAPRNVAVESNGHGSIKVTVDGAVLNNGSPFVDPSTTPLTGRYAGVGGYCQSGAVAASMNAKGETWRLYA